jgi:hypothetical protein
VLSHEQLLEALLAQYADDAKAAAVLGVDRSTVNRLRRGESRPSFATSMKLWSLRARITRAANRAERQRGHAPQR